MIWVTWRQFRAQAIAGLAAFAAAAVYLVVSGLSMHRTYTADLAGCTAQNNCHDVLDRFQNSYNGPDSLLQLLVITTPALTGIFWGAPLVARELETGTHQLAWNQSITRTRWLAAKLAGIGAASISVTGLLGYLLTWWAAPLDQINGSRFGAMTFSTRDVVPLAYAAFAFALGTTAGLLLRRTLPAMAVTLAVFAGVQILVPAAIRPHLLPTSAASFPIDQATLSQAGGLEFDGPGAGTMQVHGLPVPQGTWTLSTTPVEDSFGHAVQTSNLTDCLPGPGGAKPDFSLLGACLATHDLHESITYQPASHYWPLQWIETGMFTALATALSGFCFWWIRRRQN